MIIIHTPAHLTVSTVQPGFPAASLLALGHGTVAAIMADVVFTAVLAEASLVAGVASSDADREAVVSVASRAEATLAVAEAYLAAAEALAVAALTAAEAALTAVDAALTAVDAGKFCS
jgi:hypothetical protein